MRPLLCLSFLLLPVAAAPDEKPAEDPRRMKPGDAPTPYTADEIRKACPEGRTNVLRVETEQRVLLNTMKFLKSDEKGGEMERKTALADGTEIGGEKTAFTWQELQGHASFPEIDTKITEETIEVPAGKYDCWVYTVNLKMGGQAVTQRMHFAKSLAGPPVKMTQEVAGKVQLTMTLVECKLPAAKEEGKKPSGG